MARDTSPTRRRRNQVPVATRAVGASSAKARRPKKPADRFDIVSVGVIVSVILVVLMAIAVPLRNYYQGRSEIARLNEAIVAKQAEKSRLLEEIDRYKSEDFLKQEARRRFGVVEEGETAYRILDPRMKSEHTTTTDKQAEEDNREWYEVVWDSVAEPPKTTNANPGKLPTEAGPPPEEGQGMAEPTDAAQQ